MEHATLSDLLWTQALQYPQRRAVVCGNVVLTMEQLAAASVNIAHLLRAVGVDAGDCVGLFADPSPALMCGVWGVLAADAAYVPISPEYPRDRIHYMIEQSRVGVILCQATLVASLRMVMPRGVRLVIIPDTMPTGGPVVTVRPLAAMQRSEQLAYVIYTSGSTGQPKGVMIEQRNIVSQMRWLQTVYGIDERAIVLQKTPISFDAAQWELLAPANGSTVVMATPGAHRDVRELVRLIRTNAVNTLQCVPTLLQALVESEDIACCTSLTQVFSGGEALSTALARRCTTALPGCRLVNLYGPTECTINASAQTVDPRALDLESGTVAIGKPVDGTVFHVLDAQCKPVQTGEVGELYIGGSQVGRGYLHQPALTAERFVENPCVDRLVHPRLYRTGDLVRCAADGVAYFVGRVDNQVKLRGHRIELDEIRAALESLAWVQHAGVVLQRDVENRYDALVAFVELNPKEAALMDQGVAGAHHQSKSNKAQVIAQLANPGCRAMHELTDRAHYALPGRQATAQQRQLVFARKTYRFYEGGEVRQSDILNLLAATPPPVMPRSGPLSLVEFGALVRYLGQFTSEQRLLPKYAYASPGALYATQIYFAVRGMSPLPDGYYYYHPVDHTLVLLRTLPTAESATEPQIMLHLVGKQRAVEPIYQHNIQEVLEIEAGHIVGLLDRVAPAYGYSLRDCLRTPEVMAQLDVQADDVYLGTFALVADATVAADVQCDIYVQSHPGRIADLPSGLYRYCNGELQWVAETLIRKRDVIAINQAVYERSAFGITLIARTRDVGMEYVALGRTLQHLQMNAVGIGCMSSGYSSKSGHDLPTARRMTEILQSLGAPGGASYFCVGGRVSVAQQCSEGMSEDAVHMQGPAEMLKDALAAVVPEYMLPQRIVVLDRMPLTANGKIDTAALQARAVVRARRSPIPARTATELRLAQIWATVLRRHDLSMQDNLFEIGGDSITAVALVHRINTTLHTTLPLQVIHQKPTIEQLAGYIDEVGTTSVSRLLHFSSTTTERPIFCWPGLGGSVMNLRGLADELARVRPICGVQAHGVNTGETPFASLGSMVRADLDVMRRDQPTGPYTLWGYSFGARVAFEAAFQLECLGEKVDQVVLIAPGAPHVPGCVAMGDESRASFSCPVFVSTLFSVFAGGLSEPARSECLRAVSDESTFISWIAAHYPHWHVDFIRRVVCLVTRTYAFRYTPDELAVRRVRAPITVFRARDDEASFIDQSAAYSLTTPTFVQLAAGHYSVLRTPAVAELAVQLRAGLRSASSRGFAPWRSTPVSDVIVEAL